MELSSRAQGATEYLVILAVVMLVALVAVMLLGYFPGTASDTRIAEAHLYWDDAQPFAIVDYGVNGTNGVASLLIRNEDATGASMTITNITIGNATNSSVGVSFAPGDVSTVTVAGLPAGAAGAGYDLGAAIAYTDSYGVQAVQYGSKNLVGKYN